MESTATTHDAQASTRTLLTVNQFAAKHPAFSVGGLRWQIFNSARNGLDEAGSIVRLGKRVLIDQVKYFQWIDSQQERRSA